MIKQIDGGPMGGLISGFPDVYISKVEGDDILKLLCGRYVCKRKCNETDTLFDVLISNNSKGP